VSDERPGPDPALRARLAEVAAVADRPGALAEAALLIAAEEYRDLDVAAWQERLTALGHRAAERITPEMGLGPAVGALRQLLAEEEGFRGNAEDYYDPRNSFLNDVLDRRLGIPITLSLVYMEAGRRAGLPVQGIGLPGHFVVQAERAGARCLLDPFHGGRELDEAACNALLARVHGPGARLLPEHLQPVTGRQILIRMLANLKGVYAHLGDARRALGVVDRLVLLAPEARGELRDRARLRLGLGQKIGAIRDFEAYLSVTPPPPDAAEVKAQLRALRQALGSLN
jgi:regulator of sirC expression with transglutaminase-like and TPR domain